MTNVADTEATPARVSDTRLAAMLKDANDIQPGRVRMSEQEVTELRCALTELQERRRNHLPTSGMDKWLMSLEPLLSACAAEGPCTMAAGDKLRELRRMVSAASLPPSQDDAQPNIGVRVKALEWEDCGEELGHCADVLFGRYWVEMVHASYQVRLLTVLNEEEHEIILARGMGLEQGFAAAQSDYEQRILSAIEGALASPPQGKGETGDGWIDWHGEAKRGPVPKPLYEIKRRDGSIEQISEPWHHSWVHISQDDDIVAYRALSDKEPTNEI